MTVMRIVGSWSSLVVSFVVVAAVGCGGGSGRSGTAGAGTVTGGTVGTAGAGGGTGGTAGGGTGGATGVGTGGAAGASPSGTAGSTTSGTAGTTGAAGIAGTAGTTGAAGATGNAGASGGAGGTVGGAGSGAGTSGSAGAGGTCLVGDVNIRATTVSGTGTVNGAAVTDASKGSGTIYLVSATGDTAAIAGIAGAYSTVVAPGTYDVYYRQLVEGPGVPINTYAKLKSGIVVGASALALNVDVPGTTVSGTVNINGLTTNPPASKGEGALWLRNASGDSPLLTTTSPAGGSYTAMVVPGTYDVYYTLTTPGSLVPKNSSAKVASGVVVGTTPLPLTINLLATTVFGTVTIKGAAVTGASKGRCGLALRNAAGDSATLTPDSFMTGSYSAQIVPGTYDLYYSGAGTAFPSNTSATLQSGIVVGSSALSLNVDVPATTVSGAVTVNGAPLAALNSAPAGFLTLRNAAGDSVPLATTTAGTHSTLVIPGTYDLYYTPIVAVAGAPANASARLETGIVVGASPLTLDVDIPATTLTGAITVGGAAITDYNQGQGIITLVNAAGDRARLGTTTAGTYSAVVVPGTYDVQYSVGHIGPAVPTNNPSTFKKAIVVGGAALSLNIDVPIATVTGHVTVNGASIAGTSIDANAFFLTLGSASGDNAGFGIISAPASSYSAVVIPGSYDLFYSLYRGGPGVPSNGNTNLGCFTVR
jgi:hypothetical protein